MNENTPAEPAPLLGSSRARQVTLRKSGCWIVASFTLMFVFGSLYSIIRSGVQEAEQNTAIQQAHALGVVMYAYAKDHAGKYPTGESSTAIFQQLIDGGYITDPAELYLPMDGKTKAASKKLKPENVCWDVTDAVRMDDPGRLPLLFRTGYKINYVAGGKAIPLANADPYGFPAYYVDNAAQIIFAQTGGFVAIAPDFDPKGKTYRQLTPEGPLP